MNNIGPGAIYTPIDKDVESDAKLNSQILAQIPMGRSGRPEEVAQLAVYLASDDASYVTGSTHFIDGGMLRNAGSPSSPPETTPTRVRNDKRKNQCHDVTCNA